MSTVVFLSATSALQPIAVLAETEATLVASSSGAAGSTLGTQHGPGNTSDTPSAPSLGGKTDTAGPNKGIGAGSPTNGGSAIKSSTGSTMAQPGAAGGGAGTGGAPGGTQLGPEPGQENLIGPDTPKGGAGKVNSMGKGAIQGAGNTGGTAGLVGAPGTRRGGSKELSPIPLPGTPDMGTGTAREPGRGTAGPAGIAGGASNANALPPGAVLQGYLSVSDALNEALIRSPRSAAVRAQLGITRAGYRAATVMPNAQLFRDEGAIAEQVLRLGGQATWDPPWKLAFRLLAAKRTFAEQKLEFLQTLWSFRSDVRKAYIEVVMAQETYDALSALAELSNRLLNVSQKLFKAGSVAELDVLKARLAASQSETDRDQGAFRIALAKQNLNIIMGHNRDLGFEIPRLPQFRTKAEKTGLLPNMTKEVPPLSQFLEIALSNRLELRVLAAQIRLAEAQIKNAMVNIIPDPIITSGYSANGNAPSGPKIKAFFVTMNYELPTFNYGQADIPRLKATIRQYRAQILSQRNQIQSDVVTAYNHLVAARNKIAIYQEHVLSDSEKVARLARRSYEVGQSDITSTLAAQQANVQVRQTYLDAINTYEQAFAELEQAIGTPLR